jgi:starch phosphorylase
LTFSKASARIQASASYALNIIAEYNKLLEKPSSDFVPKTYLFAAKAAPGYTLQSRL